MFYIIRGLTMTRQFLYTWGRLFIRQKMKPEEEWNERVFLRWCRRIVKENLHLSDELIRKIIDDFTVYNVKRD